MEHFYEVNSSSELSPDLEWMIQSGQVDDATLAVALLREYYGTIYSLFHAVLDDSVIAISCVFQTFSAAITRLHEYRAEYGVRNWLYALALQTLRDVHSQHLFRHWLVKISFLFCKREASNQKMLASDEMASQWLLAFQRLGDENRMLISLRLVHEISIAKLAWIFQQSEGSIEGQLQANLAYMFLSVRKVAGSGNYIESERFREHLITSLKQSQKFPSLTDDEIREMVIEIGNSILQQKQRRKVSLSVKEFALGGIVIAVAGFLWLFSNLMDGVKPTPQPRAFGTTTSSGQLSPTVINPVVSVVSTTVTVTSHPENGIIYRVSNLDLAALVQPRIALADDTGLSSSGPVAVSLVLQAWDWGDDDKDPLEYPNRPIEFLQPNEQDRTVMPYEIIDFISKETDFQVLMRFSDDTQLICTLANTGYPVIVQRGIPFEKDGFEDQKAFSQEITDTVAENTPYLENNEIISLIGNPPSLSEWGAAYEILTGCDGHIMYVWRTSSMGVKLWEISADEFSDGWWAFNNLYLLIYPSEKDENVMYLLAGGGYEDAIDQSDEYVNYVNALVATESDTYTTSVSLKNFYAWFNRGTTLTYLENYSWAASAFDTAFDIYDELSPDTRPWKMLWYNTTPYWAYYYNGRYWDVIELTTTTLESPGGEMLEESYYWRGLAYEAIGDIESAFDDMRMAVELNRMFVDSLVKLQQLMQEK